MWRDTRRRKQILVILVALNIAAFAIFFGLRWRYQQQERNHWLIQARQRNEHAGHLWTDEEVVKKYDIEKSIERKQGISDADLTWCFLSMDAPMPKASDIGFRQHDIMDVLLDGIAQMSDAQKGRMFDRAVAMIKRDEPNDEGASNVVFAADAFMRIKDRRALPLLKPYLNDQRLWARGVAQDAISKIENCKDGCKG